MSCNSSSEPRMRRADTKLALTVTITVALTLTFTLIITLAHVRNIQS